MSGAYSTARDEAHVCA